MLFYVVYPNLGTMQLKLCCRPLPVRQYLFLPIVGVLVTVCLSILFAHILYIVSFAFKIFLGGFCLYLGEDRERTIL